MSLFSKKQFPRPCVCLALLCLALPSSGCLAAALTAGAVGAGAAGYAYYQGGVSRDFPAGMDQTWSAAQLAVTDLGMPLLAAVRDNDGGTIESTTGDGDKVKIRLDSRSARVPADGQWTTVGVRVALLGDTPFSERLLNQIDARLNPSGLTNRQVPVTTAPGVQPTPIQQTSIQQTAPPPLVKR